MVVQVEMQSQDPPQPNENSGLHDAPSLRVCLISALTVADFIDFDLVSETHSTTGAQLGILTLAAILRRLGIEPHVINLDDLFFAFLKQLKQPLSDSEAAGEIDPAGAIDESPPVAAPDVEEYFFPFVAERLKALRFDVYGLSSICSSYPLTLRLAAELKRLNPRAPIILGGPQASVVDVPTMRNFACVDFIVRGEADETFPALLRSLASPDGNDYKRLPGITFRQEDEIVRNHNAPVIEELDSLPLPAFDFDPQLRSRGGIHLEIGRGCPFACTFCSTNDFFRRNFRLKSPGKMIEEISSIKQEYGISYFSLVHDMYTVDRRKVVDFCDAVRQSGEVFTWGCSARTDCIDDDLIQLMGEAGCRGIFFGIETGSQRLQEVIRKRLDLAEAVKRIEFADSCGIETTVALIVGFPEETRDDLRDTIHFFIDALRFDRAEPQCSLLAPLAATPIQERFKDQLIWDDGLVSDMSQQGWRQDPAEQEMIKAYPEIFPNFYSIPAKHLARGYVKDVMDFATYLATWFRWLPVALLQDSGDFLQVFDRWTIWLAARIPTAADEDLGRTPYYSHRRFRSEFLEFVKDCYLPEMAKAKTAIKTLAETEGLLFVSRSQPQPQPPNELELTSETVPYRSGGLVVMDVDLNYKELIKALRTRANLAAIPERRTPIVFTPQKKEIKVWQVTPLSEMLLRLCNGRRTIGEITQEFSIRANGFEGMVANGVAGIPPEQVCLFGLKQLEKDGLIDFSPRTDEFEDDEDEAFNVAPSPTEATEATRRLTAAQATNTQQPWPPRTAA